MSSKHIVLINGTVYIHNTNECEKKGDLPIVKIKTMLNENKLVNKSPTKNKFSSLVQKLRQLRNREVQIPPPTNNLSYIVPEIIAILKS